MTELIGYARVSTHDQSTAMQELALRGSGCTEIFRDKVSGRLRGPEYERALASCRSGDVLVVWRLDRLSRSLPDLIARVLELRDRGINLRCLDQGVIDTTTATGKLVFHVFGAVAEFERSVISERTKEGIAAARAAGKRIGGQNAIAPARLELGRQLRLQGHSANAIAALLGISRDSVYRHIWGDGNGQRAKPAAPPVSTMREEQ